MNVRSENLRLRLPKAMHDQLREMAESQGVSMNTLVVLLLADAMDFTFRTPDPPDEELIADEADPGAHRLA